MSVRPLSPLTPAPGVPLLGVGAGLHWFWAGHNAKQCGAGSWRALLAVVVSWLPMETTFNREQWHTLDSAAPVRGARCQGGASR